MLGRSLSLATGSCVLEWIDSGSSDPCSTPHHPLSPAALTKCALLNLSTGSLEYRTKRNLCAFCIADCCDFFCLFVSAFLTTALIICFASVFLLLLALCLQNKQANLVSKCSRPPHHLTPYPIATLCVLSFCLGYFCFCVLAAFPIQFNSGLPANARKPNQGCESGVSCLWAKAGFLTLRT